ncbi:cysteine-rich protein 3 isoform X3 [Suncus etruscus]|uniref:cysteine-rich protein 3 isoform X3 n=1 Tax=Suncus etruscus TaxID=109475 RepID=UPI00210FD1B5|nr:cysteine-rich protein 3 isoform X3 [Suncus etruscus]
MGAEEPRMQPMRLRSEPGGGVTRRGGNVEVHPGLAAQAAASGGAMSWTCPRCQQPVFFAEKVSSLGKNWHPFCLKCERCHSVLCPGGHAEHKGRPYCHKPCYGALFGPKGVSLSGMGSYLYSPPTLPPVRPASFSPSSFSPPRPRTGLPRTKKSFSHMKTFTGETSPCPGCHEPVYFAERLMSLGKNWHRPCLRCQRCQKTLTPGRHAEV